MGNLSQHGASLLGERIGALFNGVFTAWVTFIFDWVTPSWCKSTYVTGDLLYRAMRSDKALAETSWKTRIMMFTIWLSLNVAYQVYAPKRRLIMIYHCLTGHGLNLLLWGYLTMQVDGPRNAVNKVYDAYTDSAIGFFITSYSLTHRPLIWRMIKWISFRVGLPLLCVGAPLYYFREKLPLARTFQRVNTSMFLFFSHAWDAFDYVEAQVVERFPQYLQHKWSSYQQGRPERANLPTYQYQPLNKGEIRLLVLKQSPLYPSVIQAKIVHQPIYPPPDYEAVSYCWGSPESTKEILVDGCRFPVTKAAFDLLLARRSVWKDRTLWIDAICINQKDMQEKTEQVHLMRDIYHRASRVIAFPGGNWRSRLAGGIVLQLWALVHQYETQKMNWSGTPAEARSPRWRAMADLFSSEYFTRAWIIQEVAVGQRVEVYLGGIYVPWLAFFEVMNWCFESKRRHLLSASEDKERRIWRTGQTFENVAVMAILRPDTGAIWADYTNIDNHNMIDLENLLLITANFRTTDPRDKVFSLIGIARNAGDPELTVPDYSLPVEQVFQKTAQCVFSYPPGRKTIHILALAGTGFCERPMKMPSWVPDFSEKRACYPYANTLDRDINFKASGGHAQDTRLDLETNSFIIKAITIDQVLDISEAGALDWGLRDLDLADAFKLLPKLHKWVYAAIDLCEKHPKSSAMPEITTYNRLWWTLISGRIERKPADAKYEKAFRYWLQNLDILASSKNLAHYSQRFKDGELGDAEANIIDGTDDYYQYSVLEACFGRRIAITRSGRLCIVPPLTRVGDSVIIPFGSQTPFLIRKPHSYLNTSGYELIGEAWVDGVMYGEMVGSADEEFIRIS
ncbi:HET-domain-containing protein [Xylaria bambusicola]|uniref:HET-domain-containing protein n=1 Tax=Xylaria bambusicola TaxID=326684 RepID=UPI0020084FFC|nr:HET-domain-containing protein [Xylaria bambusicola]KAI0517598.1 HET-domain-containing protein [Xylaria bambusicola]